jgi:hypothetical protein
MCIGSITYLGQLGLSSHCNPVRIYWANCWWDGRMDCWGQTLRTCPCWTWPGLPCTDKLLRDDRTEYTHKASGQTCSHRWAEDFECSAVQWHCCHNTGRQVPADIINDLTAVDKPKQRCSTFILSYSVRFSRLKNCNAMKICTIWCGGYLHVYKSKAFLVLN